tara:strand:- start:1630 stop:2097 length:468 start_codon:yes stop_codon:yes gene_type:complete
MKRHIDRLEDAVHQVTLLKNEVMGDLPISKKKEILAISREIVKGSVLKSPVYEDYEDYCHFSEQEPETEEDKLRLSLEEKLMSLTEDMDERIILDGGFYEKNEGEETVKALALRDLKVDEETAKSFVIGDVFMAINGQWMIKVGSEDYRAWNWPY